MDPKLATKLRILADAAKYDASCASSGAPKRKAGAGGLGSTTGAGICHAYTPDGRCVSLLKILLTNWCLYDCAYCVNRRSSNTPPGALHRRGGGDPHARFYKRNYIEGLFLSSGVVELARPHDGGADARRPDAAPRPRLRRLHPPQGDPEASPWLIEQAGLWADRLSINVELPTDVEPRPPRSREAPALDPRRDGPDARAASPRPRPSGAASLRPARAPSDRRRRRDRRRGRARRERPALPRLRPPPGLLLGLQPDPRAEPGAAAEAAAARARAPALPGRLADPLLRLQRRRDRRRRRERHARPRGRPQARLGAEAPRELPGRRQQRPARAAAPRSPASAPRRSTG